MDELNKRIADIMYEICSKTIGSDLSSVRPMTAEELFEYALKHIAIDENGNEIWHKDEVN